MSQSSPYDLIIIGAGALGSLHAYHALQKKKRVLLLEKDGRPQEATVRNFGQVVPSGLSRGKWQQFGRRGLEIYKGLQEKFDLTVRNNGTVYIASDETELALIHEAHDNNKADGYSSVLLSPSACLSKYPGLHASYCRGALFFPEEVTVEPDQMIHRLIGYMCEQLKLDYQAGTQVRACSNANGHCIVEDSAGHQYHAENVIICNGRDFQFLYPQVFAGSDIVVSKLQMMKTKPQPGFTLNGSILTGLTIRRYESFEECPSYEKLNAADIPERFKKWGIHVLFKQAFDGGIIIGDSHEYAPAMEQHQLGFDIKPEVNEIILEEAKRIFQLPHWNIESCWNGFYAQSKTHDVFDKEVDKNIRVVTAIGGKGMTGSAGLAEENIAQMF
ncbi:MAG: TIGR03364 family FAD-dependent oxidoreductase [Bacteroidota bacterium]|nr:TIGR03364 family FAD-dependent oxidoreductase [Bacteroidota bacterium]